MDCCRGPFSMAFRLFCSLPMAANSLFGCELGLCPRSSCTWCVSLVRWSSGGSNGPVWGSFHCVALVGTLRSYGSEHSYDPNNRTTARFRARTSKIDISASCRFDLGSNLDSSWVSLEYSNRLLGSSFDSADIGGVIARRFSVLAAPREAPEVPKYPVYPALSNASFCVYYKNKQVFRVYFNCSIVAVCPVGH